MNKKKLKRNTLIYAIKKLEFLKLKSEISELTFSLYGKKKISNLKINKDINTINRRLDETLEMTKLIEVHGFPDLVFNLLYGYMKRCKIENAYLSGEELIQINDTLYSIRKLKNYFIPHKEEFPLLYSLIENIHTFKSIEEQITKAIDPEGEVYDNATKELKQVRKDLNSIRDLIEKKLNSIIKDKSNAHIIQDAVITQREDRYVIPIKKDHKGKIKGIILASSNSGETLFLEPEITTEDNNRLKELKNEERRIIIKILKRLTALLNDKWFEINHTIKIVEHIDLVYAKARYSLKNKCIRQDVNRDGIFKIIQAKHPFLDKENVVPIDIFLGEKYNILIVTGPNTGGKTVSLKTLGLLTLMTMSGMLIPAKEGSNISVVDDIFIDIGDEQSIEQNLSTFSGHIKRIGKILNNVGRNSLVLIDELGAGTDPKEGEALGIAILEKLLEIGCKVWLTTHFTQIKNFALLNDAVETASCNFDIKTFTPTYELLYGVVGNSNAIEIAEHLSLDKTIISRSKKLLKASLSEDENLVEELVKQKESYLNLYRHYKSLSDKLEAEKQNVSDKEKQLKSKETQIEKRLKELESEAVVMSTNMVNETRREMNELLKSVKDSNISETTIDSIKKLEEKGRELSDRMKLIKSEAHEELKFSDEPLSEGDEVFVKSMKKRGTVLEINDKKKEAAIQIGDIKIFTYPGDLSKIDTEKTDNVSLNRSDIKIETESYSPPSELMLVGMRGEEAVKTCEKYIEALYVNDRQSGKIVHGLGKGILRNLIEELLRNHPHVQSFRPANHNEGGFGVTLIDLK